MSDLSSLESLFFSALKIESAAERVIYLDSVCAGDAEVRRQLEKLLRAHAGAAGFLAHWQKDPDLASLRDTEALARLPAEEQQACTQLWADVAALLQ